MNAALDELVGYAETNAGLVAAARRNRAVGAEKKHAQWLLYNVAVRQATRAAGWGRVGWQLGAARSPRKCSLRGLLVKGAWTQGVVHWHAAAAWRIAARPFSLLPA